MLSMEIFLKGLELRFDTGSFRVSDLRVVLATELQCSKCYEFLPDEKFHAGKAFPARRCRQMVCRDCLKVKNEPFPLAATFKLPTRLKLGVPK